MKHKLWDALKQVEKAEEDKKSTVLAYEAEMQRI